jgi:hypothetical protein
VRPVEFAEYARLSQVTADSRRKASRSSNLLVIPPSA